MKVRRIRQQYSSGKDNSGNLQNFVQVDQDLVGKDGTARQALTGFYVKGGHLQQQNIQVRSNCNCSRQQH